MGKSASKKNKKPEVDIKDVLSKSEKCYPNDDPETFTKIFLAICDTYNLKNPVDQIIANRAAHQIMMIQYLEAVLQKYGLFYEIENKSGRIILEMNQVASYKSKLESDFRANIRMLKGYQRNPDVEDETPKNFLEFLGSGAKK